MARASNPSTIAFTAPHGLAPGQRCPAEERFVSSAVIVKPNSSAQCSLYCRAGDRIANRADGDVSARREPPSMTLFDYWSPGSAVQRVLAGAAVDTLTIKVNGDFHEFDFSGQAQDLVDTSSFANGQFGLSAFPAEPPCRHQLLDHPGALGQVWLGSSPNRFFTLTNAEVSFQNNLELRAREFGASTAQRDFSWAATVSINFSIYQKDDAATAALYQAARQRSPISVMMQLGQQQGELFGIYMKSVSGGAGIRRFREAAAVAISKLPGARKRE